MTDLRLVVVCVAVLFSVSESLKLPKCSQIPTCPACGIHRYPISLTEDSPYYWKCNNGQLELKKCQNNALFDPEKMRCIKGKCCDECSSDDIKVFIESHLPDDIPPGVVCCKETFCEDEDMVAPCDAADTKEALALPCGKQVSKPCDSTPLVEKPSPSNKCHIIEPCPEHPVESCPCSSCSRNLLDSCSHHHEPHHVHSACDCATFISEHHHAPHSISLPIPHQDHHYCLQRHHPDSSCHQHETSSVCPSKLLPRPLLPSADQPEISCPCHPPLLPHQPCIDRFPQYIPSPPQVPYHQGTPIPKYPDICPGYYPSHSLPYHTPHHSHYREADLYRDDLIPRISAWRQCQDHHIKPCPDCTLLAPPTAAPILHPHHPETYDRPCDYPYYQPQPHAHSVRGHAPCPYPPCPCSQYSHSHSHSHSHPAYTHSMHPQVHMPKLLNHYYPHHYPAHHELPKLPAIEAPCHTPCEPTPCSDHSKPCPDHPKADHPKPEECAPTVPPETKCSSHA